ncbi:MAG: TrmH family RNA methyltransferase [Candidatus Omnitrophica bacterium]|nr:TrmH family RNA methyltransferase [Candidatus Omnitrophota bacterium]
MSGKNILNNIDIVLVEPQISENIGLTARVLKNTGFKNLIIVNSSRDNKSLEVSKRAKDILEQAVISADISSAVAESNFVFGTTRRDRKYCNLYDFQEIIPQILASAQKQKISILFGKENFGLSQKEISFCDSVFFLPADSTFPCYNLSFAVGIVCYELFKTVKSLDKINSLSLASRREIDCLFSGISQALEAKVDNNKILTMVGSLRRLLLRTHPTKNEMAILNTILFKLSGNLPENNKDKG